MTRRGWGWLAALALLAMVPGVVEGARPAAVDVRGKAGTLATLPLVVLDDGAAYVSAERLAAAIKGTWSVRGARGTLTVGGRSARLVRDQRRVLVEGAPVTLAAAPRQAAAGWLLPEDFLARALPRLAPGLSASRRATAPPTRPAAAPPRPTVAFEELRVRSYPSFTRVVVETAGALPHVVEARRGEVRVRLAGLGVPAPHGQDVDDGLVRSVRIEAAGGDGVLTVALEGAAGEIKDFTLQDPYRVVVDVFRPREPAAGPDPGRPGLAPLRVIVLDPGHGGHDPGATGPTGLQEKEVVLDVARRAARLVEEGLGIKVVLTRSTDVFVPLRDRTTFANRQRADLFVSVHANAHPRSVSEGVETYFLSSEASDNEARQVAAIENGVVQLETPTQRQKGDLLRTILWDLAQSEFQHESSALAETMQDSMTRSLRLVNRGVKQAGFYVLGGAAMPAVLVEIGFLTNPREEQKLRSPEHREAIARAILAGLADYKRRWDQRLRPQARQGAGEAASR